MMPIEPVAPNLTVTECCSVHGKAQKLSNTSLKSLVFELLRIEVNSQTLTQANTQTSTLSNTHIRSVTFTHLPPLWDTRKHTPGQDIQVMG